MQHKHWQHCNFDDTEQFIANKLNLWVGTFEDANTGANNLRLWDLETETDPGNYAKNAKPSIEVTLLRGRQYVLNNTDPDNIGGWLADSGGLCGDD